MITINRALARCLRTVFRREAGQPHAPVLFLAGPEGLRVRLIAHRVAIEYHEAAELETQQFALPCEALAQCRGSCADPVTLKRTAAGRIQISWSDAGQPCSDVFDDCAEHIRDEFPSLPRRLADVGPAFLTAFSDAAQTASDDTSRYAVDHVQLRGAAGAIIATDGYQLLLQHGFSFPWKQDVLVPATRLLSAAALRRAQPVRIGRTRTHVVLRLGAWTVFLNAGEGRFPKADGVIPAAEATRARLQLCEPDAQFLLRALPRLPGREDFDSPVTLDLHTGAAIRAADDDQNPPTELVLSRSKASGEPLRLSTNRTFLQRALRLGFRELELTGPEMPLVCREERRTYLWMGLGADEVIEPCAECVRIESAAAEVQSASADHSHTRESPARSSRMPRTNRTSSPSENNAAENGHHENGCAERPANVEDATVGEPLAEAEELKTALRTALGSTQRLIAALKRQRRQSRLVESTLAALKQLQDAS